MNLHSREQVQRKKYLLLNMFVLLELKSKKLAL